LPLPGVRRTLKIQNPRRYVMSLASNAVAVMLPVEDVDRARKFYEEKLGLKYDGQNMEGSAMFALEGGTTLLLLPRPGGTRADSTAMSWAVDDVDHEVKDLESHGVAFEDYDLPEFKTVDHIASFGDFKSAWFKDPDGNVLCVHPGGLSP
jgi:catechol 2,3-dioxygenase-like lactoylglutathione lyase family enzyme